MDRGAWPATVYGGCKESDVTEQLTHAPINRVSILISQSIPLPLSPLVSIYFIFLCISPHKINNQSPI